MKIKLCELIYGLCISLIKRNDTNKLYIFRILHIFQYQINFIPRAVDFVLCLIKNQPVIIKGITEAIASFSPSSLKEITAAYFAQDRSVTAQISERAQGDLNKIGFFQLTELLKQSKL